MARKPKVFDDIPYDDLTDDQKESMLSHARNSLVWFLSRQSYSEGQLREKLTRKNIPVEIADIIIHELSQDGFVDDAKYAEQYIYSAVTYRNIGKSVIIMNLKRAGIDPDIIDAAMEDFDPVTEEENAERLALKSLRTSKGVDKQKRITRAVGMLARKGFGAGTAYSLVNRLIAEEGEEADNSEDYA